MIDTIEIHGKKWRIVVVHGRQFFNGKEHLAVIHDDVKEIRIVDCISQPYMMIQAAEAVREIEQRKPAKKPAKKSAKRPATYKPAGELLGGPNFPGIPVADTFWQMKLAPAPLYNDAGESCMMLADPATRELLISRDVPERYWPLCGALALIMALEVEGVIPAPAER